MGVSWQNLILVSKPKIYMDNVNMVKERTVQIWSRKDMKLKRCQGFDQNTILYKSGFPYYTIGKLIKDFTIC